MSHFLRILLAIVLLAPLQLLAQAPAGINYQAVARDANGDALDNTLISVRFAVRDGSPTGAELFAETHTGITTNEFGLFTLTIGDGANVTGDLANIDWDAAERYLSISIDPSGGSSFTPLTTVQLLSVPYALHAEVARFAETIAPGAGDDWGTQTVIASGLLNGAGTAASPLELGGGAATNGQVLQWNGSSWAPATVSGGVGDNWGTQVAQTGSAISGDGTAGNPLDLVDGTAAGDVLSWNGTQWSPQPNDGDDWGAQAALVTAPLVGDGTTANPLGLSPGAADGHVLTWNAGTSSWISAAPTGGGGPAYTAGTGINITAGNVIENSSPDQTVSLNAGTGINVTGNYPNFTITATGGGGTPTYTAGNGIFIDGSNNIINDAWSVNANGVFNDQDNIGIGVNNPIEFLNVVGGNALVEAGGLYVANGSTNDRFEAFVDADDAGRVNIFGPAGTAVATLRSQGTGFADLGAVGAMEENGIETATMFGDSAGVFATASAYNTGSFNHILGYQPGEPEKPRHQMLSANNNVRVTTGISAGAGNDYGFANFTGSNNNVNILLGVADATQPNEGAVAIADASGLFAAGMLFDVATGNAEVFGDVKNFRTEHPTQPGKEIVYASIEGPEAAAYFRGTATLVNGKAMITIPEHFGHIASEKDMTVILTPLDASSKGLAVTQKSLENGIIVQELMNGTGNYSFDYEVKTVRKGFENYRVIRDQLKLPMNDNGKANERYRTNREPVKTTRPTENRR